MQEIIEGLIIGVGAGVTTAAILGAWRWLIRYRDRREQIPYIRDLIANQIKRILSATDLPPLEPGMEKIPADCIRFVYVREFQSALLVALSSRATALTYQEVSSLQKVLADLERAMTDLPLRKRGVLPEAIARSYYDSFQKLSWLGLPKLGL